MVTRELADALSKLKELSGADIMAVASWLRGEGRKALRERGATDEQIGPARMDIDRFDDAPLG
ncbi:MAG: hypothetical protein HY986_10565 [Candidatus Melainabacteria bacterium]|nr:hypothetical protein [Candidatus Melainabacteria bacterium]